MSQPAGLLKPPLHSLKSVKFQNLLSFGPDGMELELGPLNVLIGPNASGKSNFISALSLLRALPTDLSPVLSKGGGTPEWIWKGEHSTAHASVEVIIDYAEPHKEQPIRYRIEFGEVGQRLRVVKECLEGAEEGGRVHFDVASGKVKLRVRNVNKPSEPMPLETERSFLAQRKDPQRYP